MKTYDVLVLGGGTAGSRAAATAAAAGARTAMFNDGELGGLCILRGCMPTKTILHAAHLAHEAAHHRTPGVGHAQLAIDYDAVMANKDAKVQRFKNAKIRGIEGGGYEVIDARARFTGPNTVEAGGTTYRFARGAVIATGSVEKIPPIDGVDAVPFWTSDTVMRAHAQPTSVVVIGSGAIGLELAQFFARAGTRVELVSRRRVLIDSDPLIADEIEAALRAEPNLTLHAPCTPVRARHDDTGVALELRDADGATRSVHGEILLLATGRRAALDELGLEAAGVEAARGVVVADRNLRTTNSRIFVAGDARGVELLLHTANWEGEVAGNGAAQVPGDHHLDDRLPMSVVFTDPPYATVGYTAAAAEAAGLSPRRSHARFAETGRAITQDVAHGAWVLVTDASGRLLGSQILGPRADDLVHVVAAAMQAGAHVDTLLKMPWYHPTLSEVMLGLLRSAAER